MAATKYVERNIPKISLHDFDERLGDITEQLVHAASTDGFFVLINHPIPISDINNAFQHSENFFSLPTETKTSVSFNPIHNIGWETNSQVRPSTGVADRKESYQLQFGPVMDSYWPPSTSSSDLGNFTTDMKSFMTQCQDLSEKLMLCFARGLGFNDAHFITAHDVSRPNSQTVLRLLHYYPLDENQPVPENYYRAGPHVDWSFLTLLFQNEGQSGLEICPGREASTEFAIGDHWTKIQPTEGEIVCNIGDCMMRWSDDKYKSTWHRVATPLEQEDCWGDRYSIGFFNNPCEDVEIVGTEKKYEMITGRQFTDWAMERNFKALRERQAELKVGVGA